MRRSFALFITILCLITISSGVFAMTPRIQFPEWNSTTIRISDWSPEKGILTLEVTVEASRIPLKKIYSQPYLQSNFNKIQSRFEKEELKYGEKVTFKHRLNLSSNSTNWIEMDVRAMPDIPALKHLSRAENSKTPAVCKILESEADQIKAPIFIGTSLPILLRDDIALSVTPEIAFSPDFEHSNTRYYIWMPLDSAESQTTNSAIRLFKEAIQKKDPASIEATGQSLIKRFDTGKSSIVFKRSKGDKFMIPTKVAMELLKADISILRAVLSGKTEELEKEYLAMKPCYSKPFIGYNLARLFEQAGNKEKAKLYLDEALKENPAWPLAKSQRSKN